MMIMWALRKKENWLIMRGEGQGRWTIHFGPHVITDDKELAFNFAEMEGGSIYKVEVEIAPYNGETK